MSTDDCRWSKGSAVPSFAMLTCRCLVNSACPSWPERDLDLVDKTSLRLGALGLAAVEVSDIPPTAAKSNLFANRQSSVGVHQSDRKSCKQTRNARIDTGRQIQTLRQSAIISRRSSIRSQEPQANQKRPHRHRALKPNPSPISNHQSAFINPIERAASKPEKPIR